MNNLKPRILVVDDEEDICEIIKFNLEAEGFHVDAVNSSERALKMPLDDYHLFLVDIMMKGMSGFMLANELRKKKRLDKPIIFLTARNSENDKLTGFTLGADDYITKPFSIRELIARVKAVLHRSGPDFKPKGKKEKLKILGLELDFEKKRLFVDGVRTDITPNEYKILQILMKNPGSTFTREQILNFAWRDVTVIERTVDVHITRLRKKLGKYGKHLVSRSGYGYCLETE
ncbi:MAG: response regulator transcription factor [Bacteroidales bacterium]|nr:response regulator transcription factor [Bacteroidales bacterium]